MAPGILVAVAVGVALLVVVAVAVGVALRLAVAVGNTDSVGVGLAFFSTHFGHGSHPGENTPARAKLAIRAGIA
jgi:hypothetical protein